MWQEVAAFIHGNGKGHTKPDEVERISSLATGEIARLTHMRLEKAKDCSCKRCLDFLEQIHQDSRMIHRQHKNELEAVAFWCGYVKDPNDVVFDFPHLDTSGQCSLQYLVDNEKFIDSLLAAERSWLEANSGKCLSDTSQFWQERLKQYKNTKPLEDADEQQIPTH